MLRGFQIWIWILLTGTLLISSCNRAREIGASPAGLKNSEILPYMNSRLLDEEEVKARMKIKAELDDFNRSFTADLRWKKNEKIWISFSIFGIEGMRVLIDPDSIQIMDRMNSEYIRKPLSYIEELAHVELDFEDIENLIRGNLINYSDQNIRLKKDEDQYVFKYDDGFVTGLAEIDARTVVLQRLLLEHKYRNQNLVMELREYQEFGSSNFSMDRGILASVDNNKMELHVRFLKIEPGKDLSFPFSVNPNYRRID